MTYITTEAILERVVMKGCSPHYHETLGLTDSVDTKLIVPPRAPLRKYNEDIDELVASVRENGLIEPIIVRPVGGLFEVVAGARRFEACKRLRWSRIPSIIRNLSDKDAYEMSLTENIQRRTMNAVEEALAFKHYVEQKGWGGESILAKKLGKSQEYVSQRISLLSLPRRVKERIIRRQISPSIALEVVRVPDPQAQEILAQRAAQDKLTVAVVREAARSMKYSLYPETLSDVPLGQNLREPDFGRKLGHEDPGEKEIRQLENGVLILKLALARLSTLVDNMPRENEVRVMLAEKRFLIHGMIDSLIKAKVKMNRELGMTASGIQA
jgi:ParB family transcriptional regulator, chromosome partitioning protein